MDATAKKQRDQRLALYYSSIGLTALLLFASFHPLDWSSLAWFALVPMLFACMTLERKRDIFFLSACTGFLFHLVGLSWLALCSTEAWLITVCLEAIYTGLAVTLSIYIVRRMKWPLAVVLPVVWTFLDFERGRFKFFAFPWMFLGHSQHGHSNLIQIIDLTGVAGLTFLVVLANALLIDALWAHSQLATRFLAPNQNAEALDYGQHKGRIPKLAGVWGLLIIAAWAYGAVRSSQVEKSMSEGPRFLLVQTDFPSRNDYSTVPTDDPLPYLSWDYTSGHILNLTERAMARHKDYDAVVWPETTWYLTVNEAHLTVLEKNLDMIQGNQRVDVLKMLSRTRRLKRLAKSSNKDLIIGAIDHVIPEGRPFGLRAVHNSAFHYPRGRERWTGRFDKVNLVPVSEYIPGRDTLLFHWFFRLCRSFVPPGFTVFDHGKGPEIFDIDGHKVAPNICFDVSYAHFMRGVTQAGAEIHLNMSNYSWFRSSQALDFAEVQSRFRAIETRRGVVNCVNGGPSASFDANGRVCDEGRARLPHFSREQLFKDKRRNNEGFLVVPTRTTKLSSLYLVIGDAFAWILGLIALIMSALALRKNPAETAPMGAELVEESSEQG